MKDKYELEYSFISDDINTLQNLENCKRVFIRDRYLDTKDRLLEQNGFVFRMRSDSSQPLNVIYTLKGRTVKGDDNIPTRLEEETTDIIKAAKLLHGYGQIPYDTTLSVTVQERHTHRVIYYPPHNKGYILYIDETKFVPNNVIYYNIELELYDENYKKDFINFSNILRKDYGCKDWSYSKVAVGKAIEQLGFKDITLGNKELDQIKEYYKND